MTLAEAKSIMRGMIKEVLSDGGMAITWVDRHSDADHSYVNR